MNDFFNVLSAKIFTIVVTTFMTVSSMFNRADFSEEKLTSEPEATPIVSETPLSSSDIEESPTPIIKKRSTSAPTPTPIILESPTPEITPTPLINPKSTPFPTVIPKPKTYQIIPISIMELNKMTPTLQVVAQNAYQEFLRTPNLEKLDENNQVNILIAIYGKLLREKSASIKQNINRLKAEPTPTPVPIYVNLSIEEKLSELRQTLDNIQNKPEALNVIEGRKQRAYQDWIQNNPDIYSAILGSRYSNDLQTIVRGYGL